MLSAESLKQIDIELAKYPADQRRSAIMGALRIAQTEKGWLAPETIAFVADYIGISPAQAYEVATFYNMYDLEPVGKYKLTVCTNLPCALRGGMDTGEYLKKKLGIGYGRNHARRQIHPRRRRMHGRMRRRPRYAGKQPQHVQLYDRRGD